MKNTLEKFGYTVEDLQSAMEMGDYIEQNHFGDHLMIEDDNYRVWINHEENVAQGEPVWQIEYCGEANRYRWETIAKG